MPRFVLLRHECPPGFKPSHWDFMLERDGALATWSLDALPCSWAAALDVDGAKLDAVDAVRLAGHRLAYLTLEGPVSNDRGEVRRCDRGEFDWVYHAESHWHVLLRGTWLTGCVELRQISGQQWQLMGTPASSSRNA